MVDTALVALVSHGRVRVALPRASSRRPSLVARHPVEAAVLDAVGTRGHRSVDTIRWRVVEDDRLHAIGRRLVEGGLMHQSPGRGRSAGRTALTRTRHGTERARRRGGRPYADPAHDPTGALLVAVSGIGGDAGPRHCGPRSSSCRRRRLGAPAGRRSRDIDHSDPRLAAYRTGGTAATAGSWVFFDGSSGAG